ncbi:hypothetical protein AS156_15350 [Bradyrhizobium macuxiense]|uniref:Uncharacterized protein n=1 Tax=Bradyrhizobium macuxiense TaxID=1755647 RepID=A0A120FJZ7_9BRAD|nr:hypothetical protein [Bradyrhizobium macuxiense]KWV49897.1 hypothetical protein AS156_15350 [Bradyrhizobium macuxiense]
MSRSGAASRRPACGPALLDDLVDGLAPFGLRRLLLAEGLGQRLAANGLEAVDLAAGIFDGEGLGVIGTEPSGALLAGLPIDELEGKRSQRQPW